MNKQQTIKSIASRIETEYKKHSKSLPNDWVEIAAGKIYSSYFKESIREQYENICKEYESICNEYIKLFEAKQEMHFDGWISVPGEIACFGDVLFFNFYDIKRDIDENIEKGLINGYKIPLKRIETHKF